MVRLRTMVTMDEFRSENTDRISEFLPGTEYATSADPKPATFAEMRQQFGNKKRVAFGRFDHEFG